MIVILMGVLTVVAIVLVARRSYRAGITDGYEVGRSDERVNAPAPRVSRTSSTMSKDQVDALVDRYFDRERIKI